MTREKIDKSKKPRTAGLPGVKVNEKCLKVQRPADLRPPSCSGKSPQLESPRSSKINSHLPPRASTFNELFGTKCQCPST